MTIHYRTCGLVIKKNDVGEADRIFTIFTKDFGKIKISARAIRKISSKLRGNIDIFCLSEVEFIQGKNKKTLTDALTLEKFENIKKDFKKFKIAHQIAGVLDDLLRTEEKEERLWNLINEIFQQLNYQQTTGLKGQTKQQLIYYYFLWNFFSILGYKPELFHCVICQKKLRQGILYFSSKEGGIVCTSCRNKIEKLKKTNSDLVKILRLILKNNWQILSKLKIQPFLQRSLKEISEDYYSYFLPNHT